MACISHGLGGRLNPSSPAAARTEMLEEFLWTSGGYTFVVCGASRWGRHSFCIIIIIFLFN